MVPRQLSQLYLSPQKAWLVTKESLQFVLKLQSFAGRNAMTANGCVVSTNMGDYGIDGRFASRTGVSLPTAL